MTSVVIGWSNYPGTSYALRYCEANRAQWMERVVMPVWGVVDGGPNLVVMGDLAYTIAFARTAVREMAARLKPGEWGFYIHAGHGTDEVPVVNADGVVVGRAQGMVCNDSDFARPESFYTASLFEADIAGCLGNVGIIIDGCTCGGIIRDMVDMGLVGKGERVMMLGLPGSTTLATQICYIYNPAWDGPRANPPRPRLATQIRYIYNPAWAGKRAFRDLPVVNMVPQGERIVVVTACREGESAPDIELGGFSDIGTSLIAAEPKFPWDGSLVAQRVNTRLPAELNNHATVSGNIPNLVWPHVE